MFSLTSLFALASVTLVGVSSTMQPISLTTEYRINPEGIDVPSPRFSWMLEAEQRDRVQSAYQILCADSEAHLAQDEGNLWDSGQVDSSDSLHIPYEGVALGSRTLCWWKLRVWDNEGAVSAWSAPARFSVGLLEKEDWQAQWIGGSQEDLVDLEIAGAPNVDQARWIWYPDEKPNENAPEGDCWFRYSLELPSSMGIISARLFMAVDNSAELWINGAQVGLGEGTIDNWKRIRPFLVEGFLKPGSNTLAVKAHNTNGPAGWIAALRIVGNNGTTVDLYSGKDWKCSNEDPGKNWLAAEFDDSSWRNAFEIGLLRSAPWEESVVHHAQFRPVAQLRRSFEAKPELRRAVLYVTALGIADFRLNGKRISADYFTPGWTDYRKRLYYHTYDVSEMLRSGETNVLSARLANGWYAGHIGHKFPGLYGTRPKLYGQLELEYADGTRECIPTDGEWRCSYGEIRGADLLQGENYDLRLSTPGWTGVDFDDASWEPVTLAEPEIVPPLLEAYPGAPVRQFERFTAQSCTEPEAGVYVYDLGQNIVGWVRLQLAGKADQRIQVRHAEMLQDNGMVYTEALRSAQAADTYLLAQDGDVVLEPAFTFHGFRYVEIRGLEAALPPEAVTGIMMQADVPITAHFESSNPLLNQLAHNIAWGLKGNYLEAPTDCPQRDERLGWTGDAQFFMPTALYTAGIGAFFNKWLVDLIEDGQLENGSFPHVAPDVIFSGGAVAWGDAAMICPWLYYQFYGDKSIIERHYDRLIKGMDFLESTSSNYIRKDLGFGDWLNLGGGAKDEVICTAYFAYLADIMSQMADVIGRREEAARYAELHQTIRQTFIDNFVDEEGRILESSQTGYALAFAFDLIPEDLREKAAENYLKEIERFDGHLATGFIGTPRLLPTLSLAGHDDVAYSLLMNTDYPSWLFQVIQGATTMWERWNGWTPDEGFSDSRMNSFNHYAFGAVGEWLYSRIAGIRLETPGFKRIRIEPVPGGGLTNASMLYQSIRGTILSSWRIEDGQFFLDVDIPANTTATVRIPTSDADGVMEGGESLDSVGIVKESSDAESISFHIGSGKYRFQAAL
ncbi:MAG: family 78 glycoside hydrolase catalytic domain [Candidatus Hydrogenedentales bacterium]|jgi:alpha-L-rhamnosidase